MNEIRRKGLEEIKEALENLQEPLEKVKKAEQAQGESEGSLEIDANVELLSGVEKNVQDAIMGIESILEL